ncbi:MAG: exodeoxyribonuclease VII small subunit [Clostridia bacterium]|nr:exodeoxyribonuclease VII small subunit [Clostridia bacterium]
MEKMNYEQSIKRLEEITAVLEKGEVSLDEMVKLYAEGTKLASACTKSLTEAQAKITELSQEEAK